VVQGDEGEEWNVNSSRLIVRVGFLARFSAADSLACLFPAVVPSPVARKGQLSSSHIKSRIEPRRRKGMGSIG
jgi:hypothetical protein